MPSTKIIPVVLSGGMGTRLWPMSRTDNPKQFLPLNSDEKTLIQETILRVQDQDRFDPPLIICNKDHAQLVKEQLADINVENYKIILEPCGRNTAPALAAASAYVEHHYKNAYMLVLPADHIIRDPNAFLKAVDKGLDLAQQNIVTFGITPLSPHTGFGYINFGNKVGNHGFKVKKFVEKPPIEKAKTYCESGDYVWNAGIFMFSAKNFLSELELYEPKMAQLARQSYKNSKRYDECILLDADTFNEIKSESIDYAVMERTSMAVVVPVSCGWDDAGSWEALWEMKPKDDNQNVTIGDNYLVDINNSYINSQNGPSIAAIDVEGLIIISTPDIVFVGKKDKSQHVKKMVQNLKLNNPDLVHKKSA